MAKNVKVGISVDTNKGVVSVNKLNQSFVNLNQKTKDTKESFLGLSKAVLDMNAHFVQSYHGYKAMFDSVSNYAKSFIELNAQYEKTKKNIASLIAVNSSNVASFGKTLNIQEKYQLSLKQSSKTLEQFNNLSAKSGYAVSDLADIFSSFYAGASKNMNFDESIKSFENLMQTLKISGLGVEQLKMTIDGLGDGAVLSSSDLGRFLKQIGLTNEAIKEANASGNLYNLIIQKTSENVKIAQLALGGYEDNVRLLKSNIDKLKIELSKPIFESVNESLLKLNIYMEENKDSISSFIKTFQSLTPILINVSLAFASLKAYSKIAPILSKGFLELKASILDTKNALYLQRVGLLSNTQSINEINKRTIVLSRGFKALSNVAKNAIPLVLIERLFAIEDALDKAYEKTEKLNSSFKRRIEILDIEDLKKQKEQLEKELKSISDIGSFQNTIEIF